MLIRLHKFQERAFTSEKRIIINAAGIQSGKTTTGSIFTTHRSTQIPKEWNQIIVAPTYKILTQATLPKFLSYNKHLGEYRKGDATFTWHHGPTVYIRSLSDPNAIEGITDVGSIWADEAGLFSRYAWENVMGRAAFKQAPIMVTTTPYALNWLFDLWKDWKAGEEDEVEFLAYSSIDNPYFPKEEFERQKKRLDPVRFAMKYMGEFGRMEGLVFPKVQFIQSLPMVPDTVYYGGIDWGYTNPMAITVWAVTPQGVHYRVTEYYKSGLTTEEMIFAAKSLWNIYNIKLFVADPSDPRKIEEFCRAGLTTIAGDNDIVDGIDTMRNLMNEGRLFIFEKENPYGVDEYQTYHYPEKADLKIDQDDKEQVPVASNNHSIDADRYILKYLYTTNAGKRFTPKQPADPGKMPEDVVKRLNWLKKGGRSRASGF